MFDLTAERAKLDRMIRQLTASSMRLAGLMVLAVVAIAGFCYAVLFFRQ